MRILLDTHAFLSLMVDGPHLSAIAKELFQDSRNIVYFSMASAWEMAIKTSLKKLKLPQPVGQYITSRTKTHSIRTLEITLDHIGAVERLPHHHKDPFDRLIIAQSLTERLPVISMDEMFDAYPIERLW